MPGRLKQLLGIILAFASLFAGGCGALWLYILTGRDALPVPGLWVVSAGARGLGAAGLFVALWLIRSER